MSGGNWQLMRVRIDHAWLTSLYEAAQFAAEMAQC